MSNKLGIITIHSIYNYGAMLQAYSLAEYLSGVGYDAEIIDYRPYKLCRDYRFYFRDLFLAPRSALGVLKQAVMSRKNFKRFNMFLAQNISLSNKRYTNTNNLKLHDYDVLITGSDQIWNPFITNWEQAFLLKFDQSDVRKIAYSSSFGVAQIPNQWADLVKVALSKFEKLGVREQSGKDIIESILPDKAVELVLDPVFLLPKDHWFSLSSPELTPDFKYVLVYSLEVNDDIINYAKALASDKGLKIVTIHPFNANYNFADLCLNSAGPREFISLINNAEYVVTNSFHGVVFSIIMETKFCCIAHSKTGTRMTSLLERIKLQSSIHKLSDMNSIPIYETNENSRFHLAKNIEFSKTCLQL